MPKRNYRLLLSIFIILTATAVRLYHIQTQSIWFDEGWSAYSAIQPSVQAAIDLDKTNPPLYYVIVNLAARGFGDSEFALRWVSLAFGLLAIALGYQLAKQLFDARAGVMAALLTAFSPLLWWASQEARMYTLLAVLVLLCALAWHKLIPDSPHRIEPPSRQERQVQRREWRTYWRWWLVLWLSELALLYAHNTGPVIVIWLNAVTILAWLINAVRNRRPSPLLSTRYSVLSTFLLWFGGQIAVGLLWLPYFVNRFLRLSDANSAVTSTSPLSLDELSRLWQAVWTGTWAMVGHEPLLVLLSGMVFVLALVLIPWRKANARWLVLHVVMLTAGLWLALSVLGNEVHGRYLVMIAPLLLVAIAAGLSHQSSVISRQSSLFNTLTSCGRYLALATFIVTFGVGLHFATTNAAYQHDDARGMVRYYADHLTSNDSALMWSYADRYELAYYWDRLGVKAKRITLPEGADLDTVLPLLPKSGDVALNIWYTQRADYRGMMGCLLGDGTVNEPERFEAYGMTNLLFHAPTLHPPTLKAVEASLSMAKIVAVGDIPPAPADRAICVPIQITLTQPTTVDLKAAVMIENTLGMQIAHTDAIFADRVQRTSSQLPVGSTLTAYALLRLPYGAPVADYSLHIRMYDEQAQPSGYSLSIGGQSQPDMSISFTRIKGSDWAAVKRKSDLPVRADVLVPDSDVHIVAHNVTDGPYRNGDMLNLAFISTGFDPFPDLELVSADQKRRVAIKMSASHDREDVTLNWGRVQIPLDAPSGAAFVELTDGTPIHSITIESIPAVFNAPKINTPINVDVPNVGTLVGYSVTGDMTDKTQPFSLSLVWKADQATSASYTVFAQLISDDGRVLAQSDSLPANGARPTTGWRTGEYIVDDHTLTFHPDASAGTANLIVGLYDATTSQRVPITADADFITLQSGITVR